MNTAVTISRDRATEDAPVALVTGGGGGIGAACCRALARGGFRVGIHYRNGAEQAGALLREIPDGFALAADLTDIDQVESMVKVLKLRAGRLDVLVNNAGYCINNTMAGMKIEEFDAQRSLLRGVWQLTKRVVRTFMLRQGQGRIINISSVVGHTGNAGQIPYTMEKAALDAMTRSLSREMAGRNISVNSVAPGFIETAMTRDLPDELRREFLRQIPAGRFGRPEDVAEVVSFLSVGGNYINGSVIHVNGGLYGG